MDWFRLSYTALGALGIFFFGMKQLSDSLQSMTGSLIQRVINKLSSNRFVAVAVGFVITAIIQSSSITTVMVVGFVNAGLMTLVQAIGIIFGANIGTTVTGWIITMKLGQYALLLVGLGVFPMLVSKNDRIHGMGKVVFGLGLVFVGLEAMALAFTPLRSHEGFLNILSYFSATHYLSVLATIAVGCLLTLVVQSSAAMLAVTITLAATGTLSFPTACALVLGENIGTTITAILAGLAGNVQAKRAALAHSLFNIFGVIIISSVFSYYIQLVDWFVNYPPDLRAPDGTKPYIGIHIAASHTLFNVICTIGFLPFVRHLADLVTVLVKDRGKQPKHLQFLGGQGTFSPTLGLEQTHREIVKLASMVHNMLIWTRDYALKDMDDVKLRERILRYETITDNVHLEVMLFSQNILKAELSNKETLQINSLLKASDEFESIGDYCQRIVNYSQRLKDGRSVLPEITAKDLSHLFDLTISYFTLVHQFVTDQGVPNIPNMIKIREEFNHQANLLRNSNFERVKQEQIQPLATLAIVDIILGLSRVISHSKNVFQAWTGSSLSLAE